MRSISERHLAVLIPLLAAKIRDLNQELNGFDDKIDDLDENGIEERCQLQETLERYDLVLDDLKSEYEAALEEGINLPNYATLTDRFLVDSA